MASNQRSNNGVGFFSLLALLFIGLKLGHVIDWSWWWVLSPIWITLAVVLFMLTTVFVVALARRK